MGRVTEIRTGGQSGADRGAMDAALACGVTLSGWCPAGGWAEDFPNPPGVMTRYPQLRATPLRDVAQRTEWNIRDSTCCLVLNTAGHGVSQGTDIGYALYERYHVPAFEIVIDGIESLDKQVEHACAWLEALPEETLVLGVGGPRESECPGIYGIAYHVVTAILDRCAASRGVASSPTQR